MIGKQIREIYCKIFILVIENNNKVVSKAIGKMIRISPYKLNLEAKSIRGKKISEITKSRAST